MIVVFDSGIWVSGVGVRRHAASLEAVIRAVAQDRFAVCDQIQEEVVRVLNLRAGAEFVSSPRFK